MYLWDSNILRHFAEGHPVLLKNLQRRSLSEVALPSVVVAEVLRGRCEHALKAAPSQAPIAHQRLIETQELLRSFNILVFDDLSAGMMLQLQQRLKTHKRYADAMIAAMAIAGDHIVVTRNVSHFVDLLPRAQVANWVDELYD